MKGGLVDETNPGTAIVSGKTSLFKKLFQRTVNTTNARFPYPLTISLPNYK